MLKGFLVLHAKGQHTLPTSTFQSPWRHWSTCVRSMAIGFDDFEMPKNLSDFEVFRGPAAFAFLTEVACGLHSPIRGETEVFGQFKSLIRDFKSRETPHCQTLKKVFDAINIEVKSIRREFLSGLGGDSYGSYVRRHTREFDQIHILGAGKLAREIAPWLSKNGKTVVIHSRDEKRAAEAFVNRENMSFVSLEQRVETRGALVICAPVESEILQEWVEVNENLRLVLDLRAQSGTDPLKVSCSLIRLSDVFDGLQTKKRETEKRVQLALAEISRRVARHGEGTKVKVAV